jgi:hypothetical protein
MMDWGVISYHPIIIISHPYWSPVNNLISLRMISTLMQYVCAGFACAD